MYDEFKKERRSLIKTQVVREILGNMVDVVIKNPGLLVDVSEFESHFLEIAHFTVRSFYALAQFFKEKRYLLRHCC